MAVNCKRCGETCDTRFGEDPTPFCDHCAQDIATAVYEAAEAVKKANPKLNDYFGFCVCSTCRALRAVYGERNAS
jgi:hypothetical protein